MKNIKQIQKEEKELIEWAEVSSDWIMKHILKIDEKEIEMIKKRNQREQKLKRILKK